MVTTESTRVNIGRRNRLEKIGATEISNEKETNLVFFIVQHKWVNVFYKESDSKYYQLDLAHSTSQSL